MRTRNVLAVASIGGHWVQLERILHAFEGHNLVLVTTKYSPATNIAIRRSYVVEDANRWSRIKIIQLLWQIFEITVRERPDVVVTTGAASGLFAVVFGRLSGARTIWIDSVANVNEISLSGRLARRFSGLWLTQWPELVSKGAEYSGALI